MPVSLTIAASALAGAAVLGIGATAFAAPQPAPAVAPVTMASTAASTGTDEAAGEDRLVERLELACARIPNALIRAENLQERLAGDASTRGSIAWLQARIDKAEDAGRTELATVLTNRLKVRESLQDVLPERIENLKEIQSGLCEDVEKASP